MFHRGCHIGVVFVIAALIDSGNLICLRVKQHEMSSPTAKMRPSINYEQYYEYLFTYTDLLDHLFQASSLTELREEAGSFTWIVKGFFLPLFNQARYSRKQIKLIQTEVRLTRKTAVAAKWLKAEKAGEQHVGLMMGGFQVSECIKAFSLFIKLLWQHLTAKVWGIIRVQWT